jgi:chromosome segregation ATPase
MVSALNERMEKFMFYVVIIYMMSMTGLYFHMDSRIKVLQTIQTNSLNLFKTYAEKDKKQETDITDLTGQIDDLKTQIDSLDETLHSNFKQLSNLIINNLSGGRD